MLELGKFSVKLHAALGTQLAEANIHKVIAVGEYSSVVARAAKAGGIASCNIATAATSKEGIDIAKTFVRKGAVVLLKGSRGVHLETILEGL
jgi:UDP-N-acetylmuramoyl-tripeptide--D-alanyl-D-alanine ligase